MPVLRQGEIRTFFVLLRKTSRNSHRHLKTDRYPYPIFMPGTNDQWHEKKPSYPFPGNSAVLFRIHKTRGFLPRVPAGQLFLV